VTAPEPRTDLSVDGLVDVLDTLIEGGVSVSGDVIISLAGVDLIQLDLRLLLTGVSDAFRPAAEDST
jgi:hypothetical protein